MSTQAWGSADSLRAWWASPTQHAIKRPYSAESVVALRDAFPENVASNAMALKLRGILAKHHSAKTVNLTTSPLEMSSQQMMSEAGMETAYVSGGVASFTAVNDPSSDHVSCAKTAVLGRRLTSRLTTHTTLCPGRSGSSIGLSCSITASRDSRGLVIPNRV